MNRVFIDFGALKSISCIKFWNYSKDKGRGVKDIEVYFDGNLIFTGVLKQS